MVLSTKAFVTMREAKEWLFARAGDDTVTPEDEGVISRLIDQVCQAIETYLGKRVIIGSEVEYHDGGRQEIYLGKYPVSGTPVILEDGATIGATDYYLYPETGLIARVGAWCAGRRKVRVTYNAGWGTQTREGAVPTGELTSVAGVPEDIRLAAFSWIRSVWKAEPENYTLQAPGGWAISPDTIPAAVRGLLYAYRKVV